MSETITRTAPAKVLRCLLAVLIALSSTLATLTTSATDAFAAGEDAGSWSIRIHGYSISDGYSAVNGGVGYKTSAGEIAYCYDYNSHGPSDDGDDYTHMKRGTTTTDYIMANGYPSTNVIGGKNWSDAKAQAITQLAAWLASGTVDESDSISFENSSDEVVAAAHKLYRQAKAYDGGDSDIDGCSSIVYVDGKTEVQPMLTVNLFGHIAIKKVSANADLTDGNDCYSFKGAQYGIYTDEKCTDSYRGYHLTMDDTHNANLDLVPGTYYVKETQAPTNGSYAIDETVYKVTVKARQTSWVNAKSVPETPKSDPVSMLVQKLDATTGKADPQGDGTLAGAQFTVKFYGGQYSSASKAEESGTLLRSWVFETDEDGFADLADAYKVSGDALYHMSNGDPTLPLGTVVIQETKAPTGYNLDDGSGNSPKKFVVNITDDGAKGEAVYTYNMPSSPDTVKRGDFRLVKEAVAEVYGGEDGDLPQEQARVLAQGVQFQLVNSSSNAVVSPETGEEVSPGDVVCTITVDENGLASTRNGASVNGWDIPDGWTGALAYGTYTVHEVVTDEAASAFKEATGKTLLPVDDWKVTISEEGQYDAPALVTDKIPQTPLKVVKTDAETGKQIPLACSFQLLNSDGELVTYTSHYPQTETMDTWTTNASGEVTLPMLLEEGTYTLAEVQAPEGYVLALEGVEFTVGADYRTWDDPLTVTFSDVPQKGRINVVKHDSDTSEAVSDSTYIVKAASDIVTPEGTVRAEAGEIVATLTTGEDGTAVSGELYLGTYTVYEAKAKDGYALDVAEKTVALEYQGQEVDVFDYDLDVEDVPTTLKIAKVDATDPSVPVEGATFRVWNDKGSFDAELTTDADGIIELPYVEHGSWHFQETAAPDGYVISDIDEDGTARIHDFTVNDQGMIEADDVEGMTACYAVTVENMPKTMKTTAVDADSGTHEGQARTEMVVVDTVAYTGTIPGNEYTVTGVLMDKETGEPVTDASGNEVTATETFTAEAFEGTVEIAFTFDGSLLAGKSVVAFETMEHEGAEYMVHADLEDEGQTVNVVDVHTKASNPETGSQLGSLDDELELVDTVSYKGLTAGNGYTLTTHLMDRESGEALKGADGNVIEATTGLEPTDSDGEVDVVLMVDGTALTGHDVVFFEELSDSEGNVIATHADIDDEGQTIHFGKIGTTALDADDGDKNVIADEKTTIVDTVAYENLVAGKEYTVTGTLMDKATGKTLVDADGKEITSSAIFTAEKADGTVDVTFEFDGSSLAGTTAVAFETVTCDGVEVAVHADIDDAAQTVDLYEPETPGSGKTYPKTGGTARRF